MTNKKLFLFEDKVGVEWVAWLAESRTERLGNAAIIGSGALLSTARWEFMKNLEKAINEGKITIFSGNVTLIDPKAN